MFGKKNFRRVRPLFAWYDLWVGAYYDRKTTDLYVLPVPMLGFVVRLDMTAQMRPCALCGARQHINRSTVCWNDATQSHECAACRAIPGGDPRRRMES